MKIAVISDIHDNLPRLEQVLSICAEQKISTAICCGDVQNIETLERLSEGFRKIYLAFGNADFDLKNKTGLIPENVEYFDISGEIKIDNLLFGLIHFDSVAREMAEEGRFDYIFYGHTHTPWKEKIKNTTLINPGEIAGRYGQASFAIFDTQKKTENLVIID